MKAFEFAGDVSYVDSAIRAHDGDAHGVAPGLVRTCHPLRVLADRVGQAAERRDPAESRAILEGSRRFVLALLIAHDAAARMLQEAEAAVAVDDDDGPDDDGDDEP